MNYQFFPSIKRKMFLGISLLLSIAVVLLVLSIILILFVLKASMIQAGILINAPLVNPNTLIGILNSVQILIFNESNRGGGVSEMHK